MSWLEDKFSTATREVRRVVAIVRPLLRGDWLAGAGQKFRQTTEAISEFAKENDLTPEQVLPEAIELGRHKLEGWAEHERAGALKDFAQTELNEIEAERQRRTLDSAVRKEAAEARLKEIEVLRAEIALLEDLKKAGVVIRADERGDLTVLPAPPGCDLTELRDQRLIEAEIAASVAVPVNKKAQTASSRVHPTPIPAGTGRTDLAHWRVAVLGWSQTQLAHKAGLGVGTVKKAEASPHLVSRGSKVKIVTALNGEFSRRNIRLVQASEVFPGL